jgi:hypothetical protein
MPSMDTLLLAIIAIATALGNYWSYKAKVIGEANHAVGIANHGLSLDIQKQTNGMQASLIKDADAIGHAAGLQEGRDEIR